MKRSPLGNNGFTLAELLVVIAILGVLISVLLPALHRMQHAGKAAKSMSNMKQIMNAAFQHHADYRIHSCYYRRQIRDKGFLYVFQYLPIEYMDYSYDAFHSPFEQATWQKKAKDGYSFALPPSDIRVPIPSYGFNRKGPQVEHTVEYGTGASGQLFIRPNVLAMQYPEQRAYFIETMGRTGAADQANPGVGNPPRYVYENGTAALVSYMDGRVGLVKKADLLNEPGCSWNDEQRSYFWTGNPVD